MAKATTRVTETLRRQMNALGISGNDLSDLARINRTATSRIMCGIQRVTARDALAIESVLGIDALHLLTLQAKDELDDARHLAVIAAEVA